MNVIWQPHLESTSNGMPGKPRIKGDRIPVRLILIYLSAVVAVTLVSAPVRADTVDDYAALARVTATPLYRNSQEGFNLDRNFNYEFGRMATMLGQLTQSELADSELYSIRSELGNQAAKNSAYLFRIAKLDNVAPIGMEVMASSIPFIVNKEQTTQEQFTLGFALVNLIGNVFERHTLQTQYRSSTHDLRVQAASLAGQARQFASSRTPLSRYGFGVSLAFKEDVTSIEEVTLGSPAAKAGLQAGDQLSAVDGTSFSGKSFSQIVDLLRGSANSEAELLVRTPGQGLRTVKVIRGRTLDLPPIHINLDAAWNGVFADDNLWLSNDSGQTLTHVTLRVTLHDGDKVLRHLHYRDRWDRTDAFVAVYKRDQDYVASETLDDIDKVTLEIWSDQFTTVQEYNYYGTEQDSDIESRCKNRLKLSGQVKGYYENMFGTWHNGVEISFEGLRHIRPSAVTVTMTGRNRSQANRWTFTQKWRSGSGFWAKAFRSSRFNGIDPTSYSIEIEFPRSNYKHKAYWTVE